jgi:hypothetical protein
MSEEGLIEKVAKELRDGNLVRKIAKCLDNVMQDRVGAQLIYFEGKNHCAAIDDYCPLQYPNTDPDILLCNCHEYHLEKFRTERGIE